jgi:DHA2 family multidrug resistance protein
MTYLYPLFLQGVRGYNALQVGETVFVTGMIMFVAAPIVGVLGRNLDPRLVISCGFLCFAISCFELHPITAQWGFDQMFIPQALRGMALMMCIVPINTMALGTLPPDRIKNASGLFNLTRNLGGAVGLAGINTILSQRWDLHMSRLRDHVTWGRHVAVEQYQGMSEMMQGNLGSDAQMAALKQLAMAVRHQAQVMAFSDVFLIMAILFLGLLLLIPLVDRSRGGDTAPAH